MRQSVKKKVLLATPGSLSNFLRFAHKCTQGTGVELLQFSPNSITIIPVTADTKPWWIRHSCSAGATTPQQQQQQRLIAKALPQKKAPLTHIHTHAKRNKQQHAAFPYPFLQPIPRQIARLMERSEAVAPRYAAVLIVW